MKRQIKAEIIAGSLNEHGQKITTWVGTMPRMIWAEFLTHRVFSRNAASSRAIPALSMIADIQNDPFIPVAWQKEHKGMQGTEYITDKNRITEEVFHWLDDVNTALDSSRARTKRGVTKQIANRPLEAYQWYTSIFTTTETENFFNLRCPQYAFQGLEGGEITYRSKKDAIADETCASDLVESDLEWLQVNKGQGEIHISLLAEAMWDSMNEYDYKQLKAGEYHIPFGNRFNDERLLKLVAKDNNWKYHGVSSALLETYSYEILELKVKIATARCARVSYNNFEGKDDYEADIKLYDVLKASGHYSPFEHCARAMSEHEMEENIRGRCYKTFGGGPEGDSYQIPSLTKGWSGNFRGFVQLRQEL
jgi:thymidylate synthase ThyX